MLKVIALNVIGSAVWLQTTQLTVFAADGQTSNVIPPVLPHPVSDVGFTV
jgi:hypothetical protein